MKWIPAALCLVLASLAAPASALDSSPSYDDAVHCAAVNLILAQSLSASDAAANKPQIQARSDQAAALMILAAAKDGAGRDKVQADVIAKFGALSAALKDGGPGTGALNEAGTLQCEAMGKAARQWLEQTLIEQANKPD